MHKEPATVRRNRNRVYFLLVVAVFVVPFLIANWLYQRTKNNGVWSTTNRGVLIQPARTIQPFLISDLSDKAYSEKDFRGHWTLLFIPSDPCDEACKQTIYYMRQVWISLGRDTSRLQRWLLFSGKDATLTLDEFLQSYPETKLLLDTQQSVIQQFEKDGLNSEPAVFLIDPLGNAMMAFPESLDPRDILKDIKKLMKISQTG